jgi:CHAT domain-containing protein
VVSISDEYLRLCRPVEALLADPAAMADNTARAAVIGYAHDAVQWCRDHLPAGDPELGMALWRLALLDFPTEHGRMGRVAEVDGRTDWAYAIGLHEAANIFRTAYGTHSEPVLRTLSMLSWGRCQLDQWSEAEPVLAEQRDILRTLRGPNSPEEALVEAQLGDVTARQGKVDQSDTHYRRATEICGDDLRHPAALPAFTGWGRLRQTRGDLTAAMAAYEVATTILIAAHGPSSLALADHLLVVAGAAHQQDDTEHAIVLCRRAVTIRQTHLPAADPRVATAWEALSAAAATTRPTEALDAARHTLASDGHWLTSGALAAHDDAGVRRAEANLSRHADHHIALVLNSTAPEELLAEAAGVAAWRRRLPELLYGSAELAAAAGQADLDRERRSAAAELATLMQRTLAATNDSHSNFDVFMEVTQRTRAIHDTIASLDLRLRNRTIPHEHAMPIPSPQITAMLATLADDERCVELIRVTDPARYHALVFGPGSRIRSIDLGPADVIDACALHTRAALEGPGRAAAFRDLPQRLHAQAGDHGALADAIIGPLLPLLDGCPRVTFVIGSGPLQHVPLGALTPVRGGPPWLADMTITYANGLDEIARRRATPHDTVTGPDLVLAAPDYDLAATDPGRGNGLFTSLDGTRTEGERIAQQLTGARLLIGPHALKGRIRAVRSPRILHIATHAYAFTAATPVPDAATVGPSDAFLTRFDRLRREPLLRTGLALAGANTWLRHGDPGPEAETGLLTYADIAGLDILGTDLVVLSACDTGLGDILAVEGHSSLRAAFTRAGAHTVVASLWKVPDHETTTLMTYFYTHLTDGHGKAAALRLAQLDMRNAGHPPAAWGAFVCYGHPGPLRTGA